MVLYNGADASRPDVATLPSGTQIICGYVGGDTPHVWTLDEWNEFLEVDSAVRFLPIYVDSNASFNSGTDLAKAAVNAVKERGWAPFQANRRVIVIDCEENTNYEYYSEASDAIWTAGFVMVQYRSSGSVGNDQQSPPDLTWVAVPGQPKPKAQIWAGYQYHWGKEWDLDTFTQYVYDGCGRGLRHS